MNKCELLSPAGNLEKLKVAINYGADAVYIGGENFSLRANANNFTIDEIKEATEFVHSKGKKIYVTVNMFFHDEDLDGLSNYLVTLSDIGVDAFIVSDYAVIKRINELKLKPEIHISTQQSITNYETVNFFHKLGASRVVLARECSRDDIINIKENTNCELEVFIHGAMCTSYSGECVLSNYVTKRDSNRGGCSQVCRFLFDCDKTKDFSICSKDLNMSNYLEDLYNIGVSSLKIEGRMRSVYYIASVVNAYRVIIDNIKNNSLTKEILSYYQSVLNRCANRESTSHFFLKEPGVNEQYYNGRQEVSNQDFLGLVISYDDRIGVMCFEQRNNFKVGDEIEIFGPNTKPKKFIVDSIYNKDKIKVDAAKHPQEVLYIKVPFRVSKGDIIRVPIKWEV